MASWPHGMERVLTQSPLVWGCICALAQLAGCSSVPCGCDRDGLSSDLAARTDHALGPAAGCGEIVLPNGAALADGLTEDEAVLIALWNNAVFQEQLAELGIARGDLIQAGLLAEPRGRLLLSRHRQALQVRRRFSARGPLAAADPHRGGRARVGSRLPAADAGGPGPDPRRAPGVCRRAAGRGPPARWPTRRFELRSKSPSWPRRGSRRATPAPRRPATARIDVLAARAGCRPPRTTCAWPKSGCGICWASAWSGRTCSWIAADRLPLRDLDADALPTRRSTTRPDAPGRRETLSAAAERLRLARSELVPLAGHPRRHQRHAHGPRVRPGLRVTLPIFHWNEGAIARAEAELERADRGSGRRSATRSSWTSTRPTSVRQARAELDILESKCDPRSKRPSAGRSWRIAKGTRRTSSSWRRRGSCSTAAAARATARRPAAGVGRTGTERRPAA